MSIFSKIVTGKSVLFAPVYSMRSHKTGKYDLAADGNFHRVIGCIRKYKPKHAIVLVPTDDKLTNEHIFMHIPELVGTDLVFVPASLYEENAHATRTSSFGLPECINISDVDVIIAEPQRLVHVLGFITYDVDLFYWCVATSTKDWPVWFVDEFSDEDKFLAQHIPTIVATEAQAEALGGMAFVDDFYFPQRKKSIIYFPFRLSDPNYEFESLELMVNRLRALGYADDFVVLLPDLNESVTVPSGSYKLVPSDHDVYQAIINGKPIIPYFEHMDRLPHISIYEMIDAGCRIITWDCEDARKYDTITTVTSYEGFEREIIRLIEEEA